MATSLTFIQALNNPVTYSLIEQIEEISDTEDKILIDIKENLISELKKLGYTYL